ncbi:MAG: hypothetical protein KJ880_08150 [Candidatus Omnitrophica bacterium]|nr:hypothetical protein [Candidatus Omnitrophota bacterium]MBU1869861.1 hypothetical protein [Candidatus Omnitrophota bacterium]
MLEDSVKNRIILILSILTVILFVSSLSSCINAKQSRGNRQEEIAKRLDAEEKLSKFTRERANLEKQLQEEKTAHQASKKALVQEQLMTQNLKEELQKVNKLKDTLEENLKEALVTAQPTKSK